MSKLRQEVRPLRWLVQSLSSRFNYKAVPRGAFKTKGSASRIRQCWGTKKPEIISTTDEVPSGFVKVLTRISTLVWSPLYSSSVRNTYRSFSTGSNAMAISHCSQYEITIFPTLFYFRSSHCPQGEHDEWWLNWRCSGWVRRELFTSKIPREE